MRNLLKWLERNGIAHQQTDERLLIFSGNHPDGIYIDGQFHKELSQYSKRNKQFKWEWRANYTTIYCHGIN